MVLNSIQSDVLQALCVTQSIVVSLAVGSGYGKHHAKVSNTDFDQVMKVKMLGYPNTFSLQTH